MRKNMIVMLIVILPRVSSNDYWVDNYDTSKNCLQEEKIVQLENKVRRKNSKSLEFAF